MRYTDIAIIGGGLAGSTAAAMLGRAGVAAVLIDPRPAYPPDFRVEKLGGREQIERFRKTSLAEAVIRAATHDTENWIGRFGYCSTAGPSSSTASCMTSWSMPSGPRFRPAWKRIRKSAIDFDER